MHIDLITAYEKIREQVGSNFEAEGVGKEFYHLKSHSVQLILPRELGIDAKVEAVLNIKPKEPVTPESLQHTLGVLISKRNLLSGKGYEGEFKFLTRNTLQKQVAEGNYDDPDWGCFYQYHLPAKDLSTIRDIVEAFNETQHW